MYITCTPGLRCPGQQQTFFLLPSPLGTRPKIQSNDVSKAILGGFGCTQLGSRRFHFEELWFYHSICSCQLPNNHLLVVDPRSGGFFGGQREIGPGCWRNALWPSRFLGWFLGLQSWLFVQSIASHQPLRGNCWWLNWGSPTPFKRCDYGRKLTDRHVLVRSHVLRRTHIGIRFWWVYCTIWWIRHCRTSLPASMWGWEVGGHHDICFGKRGRECKESGLVHILLVVLTRLAFKLKVDDEQWDSWWWTNIFR